MKKQLTVLLALVLALTCVFSLSTGVHAADESDRDAKVNAEGFEWFATAENYANHYYGAFGGLTVVSDGVVRILAKTNTTSSGHIGFMLKKEAITAMVAEGFRTVSFKMVTEAYESGDNPGFANVYASGVDVAKYQLSIENGTRSGTEDIFYASGSTVALDLQKLCNAGFTDGLKFIVKKAAAAGNPANAPAYLVMSEFQFTKENIAKTPFEQLTFEESYGDHANGVFGGVTAESENSVKILANQANGTAGFMLNKSAVEKLLLFGMNELTVTLTPSAYNGGATPKYVVLESVAAPDYYIANCDSVAAKVDGNKLYVAAGTKLTIKLHKLYADMTAENGLKFTLLGSDNWANGGAAAYLTLADVAVTANIEKHHLELVATNGDFVAYYANETTWSQATTEKSIRAVAEAGFKFIDLSLYRLRNGDVLMQDGWEKIIAEIKAVADEVGVEFRMSHSPGYAPFGSEEWVAVNKRSVDICEMLGIKNLVVHATVGTSKENCFAINAQHYVKILPYAAEHGVNILCENSTMKNVPAGKWFFTTGSDMRELIKMVQAQGHPNFHGCWDTGHANCEGSQYLDIIALGDEMYGIHFNDNNADGDTHMVPYYGTMDVDEVMRAFKLIGYSGEFTLEIDGSKRTDATYNGPELEGGLDPYTQDRFEQEKIIFQLMNYILEKYDCVCEGHVFSDATCTAPKTCKLCGATSGSALGHTYSKDCDETCDRCTAKRTVTHDYADATCTKAKTCKDCGATTGSALGHKYSNATCTTAKTCSVCKATSGSALGHAYSNDCDAKCNRCYAERTVGDHKYTNSCDAQCDSCKAWRTASHTYSNACDKSCNVCGATRSVGAHKYSNNCDTTCNTCGAKRTVTHSYSAATCTKAKTCKTCGATSGSKLGHTYSNACDKSCNTCGATRSVGSHKYTNSCDKSCNECGATRSIKHTYTNDCDTSCNVCGAKRTIKHTYKTTTTKATLKKNGSVVKKCTECGKVASESTIRRVKTVKLSKTSYTYNGKVKTPSVTVKDTAGKTLKKGTDYTVTYEKGRKTVGTYEVTIKFIGKYSGTKVLTFKITPPKTTVKKVTPKNDALKISIDKESKQVTGYQVQYSTSKTFKKATTKTVKSYKTTSLTLKNLKSGAKYYVRVRTYKTVDGTRIYSGWSSYKTARTK